MLKDSLIITSPENQFDRLVTALKDALGSSGLTSNNIDIKLLSRLMQEYQSNEDEWRRFALVDPSSKYTRNLVDQGNGKSNLVSLDPPTVCSTKSD
jgi:cysteine dioxygenase